LDVSLEDWRLLLSKFNLYFKVKKKRIKRHLKRSTKKKKKKLTELPYILGLVDILVKDHDEISN
jgi:hypothetical protein